MESVGFKEWALVCEALGRGEQTVIVRKGGIAEGRDGFAFRHREFFLFPTFFHEQLERVRSPDAEIPARRDGEIEIRYFARVEAVRFIDKWETAGALASYHILADDVVRERFDYDDSPGIHVAFVRAFGVQPTWKFADERRYGGCRSWVDLPGVPVDQRLEPVLSDTQHDEQLARFRDLTHVADGSRAAQGERAAPV
jgi:hypothetical protein